MEKFKSSRRDLTEFEKGHANVRMVKCLMELSVFKRCSLDTCLGDRQDSKISLPSEGLDDRLVSAGTITQVKGQHCDKRYPLIKSNDGLVRLLIKSKHHDYNASSHPGVG